VVRFLVLLVLLPTAVLAQPPALRVRVVDSLSRQPLAGVLVAAREASGATGRAGLSSVEGLATLEAAGGGPWRVVVRRIGYAPFVSAPLAAGPAEAGPILLLVPAHRVRLPAVRVVATRACDARAPSPSAEAAPVWEEVTKALEASALTRDYRLVTTAGVAFERRLTLEGRLVTVDTVLRARSGERPFPALDPSDLERGYVQGTYLTALEFYAPDERAFLSAGFTRDHCVWRASETRHAGDETLIGLAFAPRSHLVRAEIQGTIWVDSATSELRRVEFEYVTLDLPARTTGLGGEVVFTRTASGAWIVSAWRMRLPHWHLSNLERSGLRFDGYTEFGGSAEVVQEVAALPPSVPRTISGSVFDSLTGRPLAGARVALPDVQRDTVTDAEGRFRFEQVGVGVWTVAASVPGFEDWPPLALRETADVVGRAEAEVTLATPAFATLWRRVCGAARAPPEAARGIVVGRVVDAFSATPDTSATVHATWRSAAATSGAAAPDTAREVRTDGTGRFVVCGLPRDEPVALHATAGPRASTPIALRLTASPLAARTLSFASDVALQLLAEDSTDARPPVPAGGALVAGRVTDTEGYPLRAARVTITGTATEARTDAQGRFTLRGVHAGKRVATVQRIGYEPARRLVDAYPGDSAVLNVRLTRMTTLAAVTVRERERVNELRADIAQRLRLGLGVFTDSLKLDKLAGTWQAFGAANMRVQMNTRGEWKILFATVNKVSPWCTPVLYIDDNVTTHDQLVQLPKDEIALIEAYRPATRAPLRYAGTGSLRYEPGDGSGICGVVLVWTKTFVRVRDPR